MKESEIERLLASAVHRMGGKAVKNASVYLAGFPDRTVLLPGGRCVFVELKAPGEVPRPLQKQRHRELRKLGFTVLVLDAPERVAEFEAAYGTGI